jgi:hypothetical protein
VLLVNGLLATRSGTKQKSRQEEQLMNRMFHLTLKFGAKVQKNAIRSAFFMIFCEKLRPNLAFSSESSIFALESMNINQYLNESHSSLQENLALRQAL